MDTHIGGWVVGETNDISSIRFINDNFGVAGIVIPASISGLLPYLAVLEPKFGVS